MISYSDLQALSALYMHIKYMIARLLILTYAAYKVTYDEDR